MKKIFTTLLLLGLFVSGYSQGAPQEMTYQAVATDDSGAELVLTPINVRATMVMTTPSGTELWVEEHAVTTDEFGLFTMQIGQGVQIGGTLSDFSDIDWGAAKHFLRVEMTLPPNTVYELIDVKPMTSVPYALYAETAGSVAGDDDGDPTNELQSLELDGSTIVLTGDPSGGNGIDLGNLPFDIDDADADPTNEIQEFQLNGDVLTLSGTDGTNSVDLGAFGGDDDDADPTNELQSLDVNGTTITLTNDPNGGGGGVDLNDLPINVDDADADPTNELQSFDINGTTITLTNDPDGNGGGIDLNDLPINVDDADADPTNELQSLSLNGSELSLSGSNQTIDLSTVPNNDNDADPTNELQNLQVTGTVVTLTSSNTSIDLNGLPLNVDDADSDPSNEIQSLGLNGSNLTLSGSNASVDLSNLPFDVNDADADPTNELQELFIQGDTIGLTGGNFVTLDSIFNDAGGFNDPGATINFPQGITNGDYLFIPDTFTVPNDQVFYLIAGEDQIRLPGVGMDFGFALTGPNFPMLDENQEIDNCRCVGFLKDKGDFEPQLVVLQPAQANSFQVPAGKNLVVKSGLDPTTPITLNGVIVNFFSISPGAIVIPDGVTVRNNGNDEIILTGYLIE